jgi:hypothetical protein
VASGVVCGFEPVNVDIRGHELSAISLGAIDLAADGSKPSAPAADSCQLVGPGVFAILGGLRAVFRRNLTVVAALRSIIRRHLAVVDSSHSAVRSISTLRGRASACVFRALTAARRAIPCRSIKIARRVVTRFGVTVA